MSKTVKYSDIKSSARRGRNFLYKENPRIVRGFKKGFADEQKRAEEKAITIRQKRGGKARIEKQAEN